MIDILLCDDEKETVDEIMEYLSENTYCKEKTDVMPYCTSDGVLKRLRNSEENSDILITDIDMPGMSGMELARVIRDENLDVVLIFMTSHGEYVYDSFEYAPFRYIRKEFMKMELLPALSAACEKVIANRSISLVIKTQDGLITMKTRDILYIEMQNRKCCIYTIQNKIYETRKGIKEIWDSMKEKDSAFVWIHRGCIVNKRHIRSITKTDVVVELDKKLPISRRKRQEIEDVMMDYWGKMI